MDNTNIWKLHEMAIKNIGGGGQKSLLYDVDLSWWGFDCKLIYTVYLNFENRKYHVWKLRKKIIITKQVKCRNRD